MTLRVGVIAVSVLLVHSIHATYAIAEKESPKRALRSFNSGFFYVSKSVGDGAVQISTCNKVTPEALGAFKKPFACASDGRGFRCTADSSLDVVFVFNSLKDCHADQKTLNSDEEH
jgi:hypothetical protein